MIERGKPPPPPRWRSRGQAKGSIVPPRRSARGRSVRLYGSEQQQQQQQKRMLSRWVSGALARSRGRAIPGPLARNLGSGDPAPTDADVRVCVVGSGPAGIYCAQSLVKKLGVLDGSKRVAIDVVDRRPIPGGLARYGVAPDHAPSVSAVLDTIDAFLSGERVRFFGNVEVVADGRGNVHLDELRAMYDAVVLAHGADRPNWLGIEGEAELRDGNSVTTARDLVAFYCGDPLSRFARPSWLEGAAKVEEVVVIGAGNVALDAARMILTPPEVLEAETDCSARFIDMVRPGGALADVARVTMVARRGPRAAAFAPKELREVLSKRPYIKTTVDLPPGASPIDPFDDSAGSEPIPRAQKRVYKLLRDRHAAQEDEASASEGRGARELIIRFLHKPLAFVFGSHGAGPRLEALRVQAQREGVDPSSGAVVVRPNESEGSVSEIPCQLAVIAASQETICLDGVPRDRALPGERMGSPLALPRATLDTRETLGSVYFCGWANRGAKGIIGASMVDADEVSASVAGELSQHWRQRGTKDGTEDLGAVLTSRGVRVVTKGDWDVVREEEGRRGREKGRKAERVLSLQEVLQILDKT